MPPSAMALSAVSAIALGVSRCVVGDVRQVNLPVEVGKFTGTYFPEGIAMRFSRLFGMHVIADADDPYCALLHDPCAGRAFWLTLLRGQEPVFLPLPCSQLTRDGILELIGHFGSDVRRTERSFPFKFSGMDPLPRIGRAA